MSRPIIFFGSISASGAIQQPNSPVISSSSITDSLLKQRASLQSGGTPSQPLYLTLLELGPGPGSERFDSHSPTGGRGNQDKSDSKSGKRPKRNKKNQIMSLKDLKADETDVSVGEGINTTPTLSARKPAPDSALPWRRSSEKHGSARAYQATNTSPPWITGSWRKAVPEKYDSARTYQPPVTPQKRPGSLQSARNRTNSSPALNSPTSGSQSKSRPSDAERQSLRELKTLTSHEIVEGLFAFIKRPRIPIPGKGYRGHPCYILGRQDGKVVVLSTTSWSGQTREEKFAPAKDKEQYERFFCVIRQTTTAERADQMPSWIHVVQTRPGDAQLFTQETYIDCRAVHEVEDGDLEKYYQRNTQSEAFLDGPSRTTIRAHLDFLAGVDNSPWMAKDQESLVRRKQYRDEHEFRWI